MINRVWKKLMFYWRLFEDNHGYRSMIASFSVLLVGTVQWEVFWIENLSWIFFSEVHVDCIPCLGYYFSGIFISYDFVLCIAQSEGDLWRFHVEVQEAYTCKQILGLCHVTMVLHIHVGGNVTQVLTSLILHIHWKNTRIHENSWSNIFNFRNSRNNFVNVGGKYPSTPWVCAHFPDYSNLTMKLLPWIGQIYSPQFPEWPRKAFCH